MTENQTGIFEDILVSKACCKNLEKVINVSEKESSGLEIEAGAYLQYFRHDSTEVGFNYCPFCGHRW